jgi:putative aminopeptidase FrvX
MDKQRTLGCIKELSNAPGVPGFEDEALKLIRRHGEGLGEWDEDAMRNLYLRRPGKKEGRPTLMIDAHSDEVGFMIRAIRPNGTMDFVPLGGWVASNVSAHRVLVRNDHGEWLPGIVASKPPHFFSEAEQKLAPELAKMVIDVGATSDREIREDYHISMAAPVVPDVSFEFNQDRDIMIGKAFDDRLGCAAIISVLSELKGEDLPLNIVGAFASQEEIGYRGAKVTTQIVKPDIAIAFEGCPADDTVLEPYLVQTAIKRGPMLRHIDAGMISNPRFQRFTLDTAREKGIPVQEAVRVGGYTDGAVIHTTDKAVPVIVIGVPVRYIHTHYGIAAFSDYENTVKLACEVIRGLNAEVIARF